MLSLCWAISPYVRLSCSIQGWLTLFVSCFPSGCDVLSSTLLASPPGEMAVEHYFLRRHLAEDTVSFCCKSVIYGCKLKVVNVLKYANQNCVSRIDALDVFMSNKRKWMNSFSHKTSKLKFLNKSLKSISCRRTCNCMVLEPMTQLWWFVIKVVCLQQLKYINMLLI